ncbi:MAG: hypothetical protein F6K22_25185 [Okeania sp. SIO2F4]|uniref:hypothetical protein n=1 Tax=Okeania sp. SIO2F4 TaxID=2607790 RepID=UPI00142925A3|nr:hypothetical protein [Okeania sp. SIO2F4]NES05810.1 hypothetical protein [Okeania sp. SIO2F4]
MPTMQIGLLVLGGILVLIALVGGKFKIFGAEVEATTSNPFLRFIAFFLGTVLIIAALNQSNFLSTNSVKKPDVKNLEVHADSYKGTPWQNKSNEYIKVRFEANGEWLAIPEHVSNVPDSAKGYLSAKGDPNFRANDTLCTRAPLGALVVMTEDKKTCEAYGEVGDFALDPGETVYFIMNDVPELYRDNKGDIDVKLYISKVR